MPQLIPVVVKVLATKIIAGITIKAVVIAAIKVAASYAISKALSKGSRSKSGGLGSGAGTELTMSRDPSPARRVVYGQTRVSGPMAFCHVSGSGNSLLGLAILLAGHECDGIASYYVDDVAVYPNASGDITSGTFSGKMNIFPHLGDQTAADAGLVASSGGAWGSSHILKGITYIACHMSFDAEVFSAGLPNISVVLRGKKVFDPRTSTTAFSRNPALILRDYLLDDDYGLGATADEIDDTSFIAAANICDETVSLVVGGSEPRYRCDGVFTTDAEPATVIEQMLATMGGSLVYAGGKFRCNAGAYYSPTVSIDEGDLRGPIQYQTAAGIREVCNIVKGTYTSPVDLYQPRDFPQYRNSAHVTEDGEEIVQDLDLAWVSSASQAQRLAKIHEKASRLGGTITLQCNLSAMRVQAGDTIAINNIRFGWAPKVFLVQEFRFAIDPGGAMGIDLVCRETSPDVYGWTAASDEQSVSPGLTIQNPKTNGGLSITASLNNDSATVPSAADGSSPVLGPAVTTISIHRGAIDDSANWAVSASPSAGVTGTLAGKTWTTTGFTVDAGYVDFTATRSGYSAITVRFVLAKARAGASGANGTDGTSSSLVSIYKRSATVPAVPSTTATFTFATGVLSGHNNGWTQSVPANDGNPVYVTTAIAAAAGASDTIVTGEWAAPVVHAANGANGANGTNGTNGVDGIPAAPNMLQNSDFVNDASGWTVGYNPNNVTNFVGRADASGGWGLAGAGSLSQMFPGVPTGVCVVKYGATPGASFGCYAAIPIVAGQRYQASAYLGVHRLAHAVATVSWWTAAGVYITENYGNAITSQAGGTVLSGYGRSFLFATAPANAAFAAFGVRSTFNGGTDCYMFATRCFFGDATATQTVPSPWMPAAPAGVAPFTLVNDANCAVGPNWVQRTVGSGGWDAAAHTLESYVGGAYCSFRFAGSVDALCGLTTDPVANNSYDSIDYAWHGSFTPEARIFENGVWKSDHGAYTSDTVLSVTYDGKQVQWLKDGVVCRTVAAPPNLRLYFDSSISTINSKIMGIAFGPSGAAGADATAYWLVTSSPTLKLSDSTFTPATVTFTGKSQTGAGAPGGYACRFIIAESTDGSSFATVYTSSANEASKVHTPSGATVKAIRCRMYQAGGTSALVDEEIVNVIGEATPAFSGGSSGGGGTIQIMSYTVPSGLSLTLTVPAGARSIQFSGSVVNHLNGAQTVRVEIRVGSTTLAFEEIGVTYAGQSVSVYLSTVTTFSAGAVTVTVGGWGTVGTALLQGQFIIL